MNKFRKILLIIVFVLGLFGLIGCKTDPQAKEIEKMLTEIFENHESAFIADAESGLFYEYNALAGVYLLKKAGYKKFDITKVVSKEVVSDYVNSVEINGEGIAFKCLQLVRAYGLEVPNSIIEFIKDLEGVTSFYSYPMVLSLITTFENNQSLLDTIIADIPTVHTNEWFDTDTASFILATSTKYEADKSNLYTLIEDNSTAEGVKGWDGNPGSSSTALAVIAYVSNDKSLQLSEEINLLDALIAFYDSELFGFKANLTSEDVDLQFATPQCFAALSLYLASLKFKTTPNLYY